MSAGYRSDLESILIVSVGYQSDIGPSSLAIWGITNKYTYKCVSRKYTHKIYQKIQHILATSTAPNILSENTRKTIKRSCAAGALTHRGLEKSDKRTQTIISSRQFFFNKNVRIWRNIWRNFFLWVVIYNSSSDRENSLAPTWHK